jgi:hypothetical protein
MVFALIAGTLLGLSRLDVIFAAMILVAALVCKIVFDVKWDRVPLTGSVSSFAAYSRNLERAGESTDQAWISYTLQLLVFGTLIGMAAYGLVRYFAPST